MDNIMVPVDFSSASSWGFYYAYDMALANGVDLIVLNLYWPPYVESTYPMDLIQRIRNQKEVDVLRHLQAATKAPLHVEKEKQVKITYLLESGAEHSIASVAEAHNIDLIIMGTHGEGKAMDKVWGTNTSNVIKNASCPVLAIPEGATYKSVCNIAYASNFDEKDTELLLQLSLIAIAINAKLHCVHVNIADQPFEDVAESTFRKVFEEKFANLPVSYSVWSATSVKDGLATFCRINKINILAMLTHNKTFWDKIFTGKSITESVTMKSNLPLLAFHK